MCAEKIKRGKRTKANTEVKNNINKNEPWNEGILKEIEYYDVRKLLYINMNWTNLGESVGKAFIDGELVDNEAFKTIIDMLILSCESNIKQYPIGRAEVIYKQKQPLNRGRFWAETFAYINMARPVRHTVAEGLYIDIDVVNCHPNIYRHLCYRYEIDCPHLTTYIKDAKSIRDKVQVVLDRNDIKEFDEKNKKYVKLEAKKLFLKILNGGNLSPEQEDQICNIPEVKENKDILYLTNYYTEIKGIIPKLYEKINEKYPDLRVIVANSNGNNKYNFESKVINKVLEDYENQMRYWLSVEVKKQGFDFSCHCYDGGMSYKPFNQQNIKEILDIKHIEEVILDKTGVKCQLKYKDFDEGLNLDKNALEKITYDDFVSFKKNYKREFTYEGIKEEFEKTNFKVLKNVKYYTETYDEIKKNKNLIEHTKTSFMDKYENMMYKEFDKNGNEKNSEPFINRWIKDPNMKTYQDIRFIPPPNKCPDNIYNTWIDFRASTFTDLDDEETKKNCELIKNHLKFISGGYKCVGYNEDSSMILEPLDEACHTYVLNWFAHIFQKPAEKVGVALFLKSNVQGVGKSLIYEALMTNMLGERYCFSVSKVDRHLFGDFNSHLSKKLFIFYDECKGSTYNKYEDDFKKIITAKTMDIEKKGAEIAEEGVDVYQRFYFASNNNDAIKIDPTDRRTFANNVDLDEAPPKKYFDSLIEACNNPSTLRKLYDYLKSIDLSGWDANRSRPITECYEDIKVSSLNPIQTWLKHFIIEKYNEPVRTPVKYKCQQLIELYKEDLHRSSSEVNINPKSFGLQLKNLKLEGLIKIASNGITSYQIDFEKCINYMRKSFWMTKEEKESFSEPIHLEIRDMDAEFTQQTY